MDSNEQTLHPGLVIGRKYELIEPLGRGAMGVVWKAKTAYADFAVKFISPELLAQDDLNDRFERERSALFGCRNIPNVAAMVDFIDEASYPKAIVMQYVHGQDLCQHIKARLQASPTESKAPLFEHDEFLRMATSICSSLSEVHRRGIVHRDIKPSNIVISSIDMVPYVTDFGIAQFFQRHANDGTLRKQSGTKGYMAPEVVLGSSANPMSDQWSLAATFYAALTGFPPTESVVETERVPLSTALRLGSFANPIIKALRNAPSDRFSTVEEFLREINQARHQGLNRIDTAGMISGRKLLIDGNHTYGHLVELVSAKSKILSNIVRLDVVDSRLDGVAIKNLLQHLPAIKVVEVKNARNIEPMTWSELLERPLFEVLRISQCDLLKPKDFDGKHSKRIKWLDRDCN